MNTGLAGKRALVLGASRGLGAAIAQGLAAEGALVHAAARSTDAIRAYAQEATGSGVGRIDPIAVDLSKDASVTQLLETLVALGGVDILVNNGGGPKPGSARGQSSEAWITAFQTMAASIFRVTDAVLSGMIERRWGRIITVGSSGIEQPLVNLALSNSVRGAVAGWSKTLSTEMAPHGITVNMVLPGRIDTDRVRELDAGRAERSGASVEDVRQASRAEIPVGRYGRPEEFAACVVFLASVQASYITGSMIRVDGGLIRSL